MRQLVSAEILFRLRPQDEKTIFEIFDHNNLHARSAPKLNKRINNKWVYAKLKPYVFVRVIIIVNIGDSSSG